MIQKIKTKKSATKRFSFTSNGKIKRKQSKMRHMLRKRSKDQKRSLRKINYISKADKKSVLRMLPNHH